MNAQLESIPIVKFPGKEKVQKKDQIKSKKVLAKIAEKEAEPKGPTRKQRNRQARKEKLSKRKRDKSPDPFLNYQATKNESTQETSKKPKSHSSLIPKFNEYAEAPPVFTFVPKQVLKQKNISIKPANSSKSQDAIRGMVKRTSRVTPLDRLKSSKKNTPLSASQSHFIQIERNSAIEKYRSLKKNI
ncbi:hypothetical protein AYI68_g6181 [Smittium mucronatum]|uniref:Uncharacterized protein n=1 Tax=Smittium mucronatum TaxID=133383 RepID=A0A1R0GS86_9FUNG|nr:hypothetical protein AYI68_g6181 [Smittium mucronatum]